MRVKDGESSVKSSLGTCFTLQLFIVILVYSLQKVSILASKSDTRVNEHIVPYYFDSDFEFGFEDGFNLAFFFFNGTNFLDKNEMKSFGQFEVSLESWAVNVEDQQFSF